MRSQLYLGVVKRACYSQKIVLQTEGNCSTSDTRTFNVHSFICIVRLLLFHCRKRMEIQRDQRKRLKVVTKQVAKLRTSFIFNFY